MNVSLQAAETAVKQWTLEAESEALGLTPPAGYEVRFDSPVSLRLSIRRVGEEFFLDAEASVTATYTCVRCLAEFAEPLTAPVSVIVHRVQAPKEQGGELDLYVEVPLGTAEFDVEPWVREALLLAVLPTPHCRPDCKGLCAHCGANLNEESCRCHAPEPDPRWDGLRQLKTTKR